MTDNAKDGQNMRILEQMVKHNITDIKEMQTTIKDMQKDITKLEQKNIIINNDVNQIKMLFTSLEVKLSALQTEWKEDKALEQTRYNQQQKKRLEQYERETRDARNRWWGFAFLILGAVVLVQLGLK